MTTMTRAIIACVVGLLSGTPASLAAQPRPNILFIAIDDLRPELGCYGVPRAITPNIDRLAADGVRFDRACVTYPLYLPSRASMLTGLRIDYRKGGTAREFPELIQLGTTWPRTFRDAGYWTATSGKVYHGNVPKVDTKAWDVPGEFWRNGFRDWSPELMKQVVAEAGPKEIVAAFRQKGGGAGSLLWQAIDGGDDVLTDGQTASIVIKYLQDRPKDKPFVICARFSRPHMPWLAPKQYFDLYAKTEIKLPAVPRDQARKVLEEDRGAGVSKDAASWNEGVSDEEARTLIKGYLASVSYADAQVGRLLKNPAAEWDHPAYISAGTYHGIVTERYRFAISDRHPTKLFDLRGDPEEWNNLANVPAHTALVKALTARANAVWGKAK